MTWIKRNLYFLLGSLVALALMIVGCVYLFSQISKEAQVAGDIEKQYAELTRLSTLNPHPGDEKIDNIKAAKSQEAGLRAHIAKTRALFQRITPIPDPATNKVSNSEFAAQLRNTVSQLRHTAEQQSILLPPDYYFTFEAQKKLMIFAPASLDRLAVHLGEIKAICEVLFDAKVNALDGLKRETVSENDNNPPDYLVQKTVSTPLADLTPYEVSFRCFSTELASVLGNLANSPYGFMVKTINVEPASPMASAEDPAGLGQAAPGQPQPMPMVRNGLRPGSPAAPATGPAARGPQIFLHEKLFRVTLLIEVVKTKSTVK